MGVGRPGAGITSPVKIVANIFISFIGAGMLGLPFAFKEAGIMEGALIMAVVGYLSVAAMLMLIDCKYAILSSGGRAGGRSIIMEKKVPLLPPDSSDDEDEDERHPPTPSTDLTYGDVGLYALGPGGKRLVDIAIVVSQIGFCCGYLIYLCKNLNLYIPRISQKVWLILLLPPLYLLTLLRHLNKLAVFSLFAQISNVLALAVVFWFDFSHSEEVPFQPNEFSIKGFPFFFAVAIYCYEGAGMIFSLEESVAEKKRDKFRSIFVCTMTGLTTLYICFGVSGYASFGPHTMDIITLNLPHSSGSVDFAAMVKICLGISLFFTYPMMMFPVTHLLDKTFGLQNAPHKGNMLRMVLVGLTGLVVSAVPNFGILISLIGATCCTLLAFILPAAFHLSIFRQRLTKRQWYFDMFLVVLGVIGSVVGLWDAFNRMSEGHDPLLEVNEFSQSTGRNNSLHNHIKVTLAPASNISVLSTSVLKNITEAEATYGKLNTTKDMTQMSVKDGRIKVGKNKTTVRPVEELNASSPSSPSAAPGMLTNVAVADKNHSSGKLNQMGSDAKVLIKTVDQQGTSKSDFPNKAETNSSMPSIVPTEVNNKKIDSTISTQRVEEDTSTSEEVQPVQESAKETVTKSKKT
ncbi:amino acid transporter AVT3B-like isoform X1 [Penaeus monodon]|uniref:amino acid transporter AVT3B-like isoform X1 n=1 Tax=Penaeus monodon TaxID=6687 RepID=UPI0018A70EB4|nr:amino acid transporter AVT3B-like isoform X1 [Penaeus monodon]